MKDTFIYIFWVFLRKEEGAVRETWMETANAIRQFNTNKQDGSVSADQPDHDETISLIQSNTYLPEEKKKKLIERLKNMQKEHVFQKLKMQVNWDTPGKITAGRIA